jgi:hypothetical protein
MTTVNIGRRAPVVIPFGEDFAHTNGACMVGDHGADEVCNMIATQVDGHALVSLVIQKHVGFGGEGLFRLRRFTTAH